MRSKKDLTEQQREVMAYLERYDVYRRILSGNRHARAYFRAKHEVLEARADDALLRAKMTEIRRFVVTLPDCREKMLLYYRYIHGHSVDACAEMMEVSRRTAFRIATDAIVFAADNFENRETF